MIDLRCPICEKELIEYDDVESFYNDRDEIKDSFCSHKLTCQNEICPMFDEGLEVFFDFDRVEIGDETSLTEEKTKKFKEEYEKKSVAEKL